LKNKKMTNQNR